MRYNLERNKRLPKGIEIEMTDYRKRHLTDIETHVLTGAESVVSKARDKSSSGDMNGACQVLEKGLKNLSTAIENKKGDVHKDLHGMQKEMAMMLGRLRMEQAQKIKSQVLEGGLSMEKARLQSEACRVLEKGLKNLSTVIENKKGDRDLNGMHKEMTILLGRWRKDSDVHKMSKIHGHEFVHAEKSKPKTAHTIGVKTVINNLMDALEQHEHTKEASVRALVSHLESFSEAFLRHGDLKRYKTECNRALEEHQAKYERLHHRQPKGIFSHIVDAVRAMFRLLEKMVNYVFGTQLSMFKKPDSELGKAMKNFQRELNDLQEYKEPKVTHRR